MGGTNLTNVNFASVGEQVKIIDTLKYYQTSLAALTSTADEKEKSEIRKTILNFLNQHDYFNRIWPTVEASDKNKILDIIESGKGVMPYEKIRNIESLDSVPHNDFFDHTEFYSSLKQANVSKEECTLSGCVQRDQSKVLIALPTCYEHAEIFEKSLIGGFSCVNTRLGFDSEVMLPSFTKQEYAKMNIDQSFKCEDITNSKLYDKLPV